MSAPSPVPLELIRRLARLGAPYKKSFALVVLLAGLATAASLVEPLIYRVAVNDVAGVFVHQGATSQVGGLSPTGGRQSRPPPPPGLAPAVAHVPDTHRRGHVAHRTPDEAFSTLLWAVFLLFVTALCARFFSLAADGVGAVVANRIEEDLIHATFGHVLRLPLQFFGKRASGALAKQIDQSDQVAPIVTAFTQEIAPEALRVVGILAIMFTQSKELTLAALATMPGYLWVARRSSRKLETGLDGYYGLWEEVGARIQDALAAVKTVKLSGAEPREAERLKAATRAAYGTFLARNRQENRYVFWQAFLIHLGKALVFGLGGWKALEHQLTPGDVVMFVAYLDQLYDPIDTLTSLAATLQQHAASLARAMRLLETGGGEAGGVPLGPGKGRVEFEDVRFGYTPEREVLRGLSFTLEPGTVTALVGPSGAGKTTASDLLLKLYEPASGAIRLDGQDLATLDPSGVRQEVGVVAADGAVFRGTLADNIRYKRPDASDDDVRAAALASGLGAALERLPEGLATEIGERGMGLSVGERQRLQIARVLLARPRLLILDEATANLDYATEADVKRALAETRGDRTTLVIAHRFSMIEDADRVLVLDGGRVVEEGTPAGLAASGGWFAKLASSAGGVAESEGEGEPGSEGDDGEGAENHEEEGAAESAGKDEPDGEGTDSEGAENDEEEGDDGDGEDGDGEDEASR